MKRTGKVKHRMRRRGRTGKLAQINLLDHPLRLLDVVATVCRFPVRSSPGQSASGCLDGIASESDGLCPWPDDGEVVRR